LSAQADENVLPPREGLRRVPGRKTFFPAPWRIGLRHPLDGAINKILFIWPKTLILNFHKFRLGMGRGRGLSSGPISKKVEAATAIKKFANLRCQKSY
jgi:hypothetical protein